MQSVTNDLSRKLAIEELQKYPLILLITIYITCTTIFIVEICGRWLLLLL